MAFVHGKDTVLVGDEILMSGDFTQTQVSGSIQLVNINAFGTADDTLMAGPGEGSVALSGIFDDGSAAGSDFDMNAAQAAAVGKVVTVGYGGLAVGNRVSMLQARSNSYNVQNPKDDAVRISATFDADGGVRQGVSLHAVSAETGAGDYASVDNAASTALGGVGHLHVTAFTGTDCVLSIQDSADDAIWADLNTFTTVTGVTQEKDTIAVGTVNRYVRATIESGTFSSITFNISFARNFR